MLDRNFLALFSVDFELLISFSVSIPHNYLTVSASQARRTATCHCAMYVSHRC